MSEVRSCEVCLPFRTLRKFLTVNLRSLSVCFVLLGALERGLHLYISSPTSVYNAALPSIGTFLKVVLKREKLSEDAELLRSQYELVLHSLEQGHMPSRPVSIICDDDSGYFSANRPKVREFDVSVHWFMLST